MKHILNAGQAWFGRPVRGLALGNRRPVAMADAMSLPQDSPATTITVLANDFDPEGGVLTVVAASALVGSVSVNPDNTLSYTPLAGYAGPDTINYTIEDDQGQSHSADVTITVDAPGVVVVVQPDNTLDVEADLGPIDITVTQPPEFAGTWSADTADLASGPANLVRPAISGTVAVGQVLTASGGLWMYDVVAGAPAQGWQWRRDGADIIGETANTYTLQAGDPDTALTVVETITDSFGARSSTSAAVGTVFDPSADPALLGWWDATDAATITASGSLVSSWADKAGGPALTQGLAPQQPETGVRALNGLNMLDFDGGRLLVAPGRGFPAAGDVAFHMVLAIDAITNLYEAVLAVEATNDFQIDAASSTQFDGRLNTTGIGTPVNLSGGPFSGAFILSAVFDRTGLATAEIHIGGVSRGTTGYTVPIDASAALHLMGNRSQNAWVNGAVGELIITGDIGNRADHHTYLANKWGLT